MNYEKKFIAYNMKDIYHEYGEYDFRIVFDAKLFTNCHNSLFSLIDSDGNEIRHTVKKWGKKIHCLFFIDSTVADGLAAAVIEIIDNNDVKHKQRFTFWVIKP